MTASAANPLPIALIYTFVQIVGPHPDLVFSEVVIRSSDSPIRKVVPLDPCMGRRHSDSPGGLVSLHMHPQSGKSHSRMAHRVHRSHRTLQSSVLWEYRITHTP